MHKEVGAIKKIYGEITVPGDKSISHRALLLGSLAEGDTEITGFLAGQDCLSTLNCLTALGIKIDLDSSGTVTVHGKGLHGFSEPTDILNAGNSGTTARLLLGILAGQSFFSVLTGDESLRNRPMGRVINPLALMGASIKGRNADTLLPLGIVGNKLQGIEFNSMIASAQLKSALLLAGLYADSTTTVVEPYKSRDHSERMLTYFGADLSIKGTSVSINPQSRLNGKKVIIPGDFSSAAFHLVAALIVPESELIIKDVGFNPTRTGLIEILRQMGANITIANLHEAAGEPVADILVKSSVLQGTEVKGSIIPTLIDEIPILAVAALFAEGDTVIREASELRVKESDRIAVLVEELQKIGGKVTELPDGLRIQGGKPLSGGICDSHNDHRIAMALAVAGLRVSDKLIVQNHQCINISYPDFFADLEKTIIQ